MPKEFSRGSMPKLASECSHSKFLPYGALVMVALYWASKYPPADLAPYIGGTSNAVSVSVIGMIGLPAIKQAKDKLSQWWSRHVEISVRVAFWLGKKGVQPPP